MEFHRTQPNPPEARRPRPPRASRLRTDAFDGVLLIDKPPGFTSHDVVAKLRNYFAFKKVGHGGTLDPMATGLLILLMGRATKLSDRLMGDDKEYEGIMQLGIATDSQDADGQIVSEHDPSDLTREEVEIVMQSFKGDQMQIPPMVSAIKKDGVPLYKLARKGKVIEREPRLIHVYRFDMTDFRNPEVGIRVRCTKGTYVRTLCADVGEKLGCGAHLAALRRTAIGEFHVRDAITLDDALRLNITELQHRSIPIHLIP
jgi:tRNA pseudouridine55 synthase